MGPDKQFVEFAKLSGLQQWAAQRGVPSGKSSACLANQDEINKLVQINGDVTAQYPEFSGTPGFVINGKFVGSSPWNQLETQLREALGS
jgi:protein-disulfide isomerase